jgi:hypothetical protein
MKFFPLIFAFAFFSCTDVSPSVSAVKSVTVFDYGGEKCESRLAVFVEVKSDVHLAKKLTVKCEPEGYEWTVENPVKFQQDEKQSFAGYANLVAPEGKKFRGENTRQFTKICHRGKFRRIFLWIILKKFMMQEIQRKKFSRNHRQKKRKELQFIPRKKRFCTLAAKKKNGATAQKFGMTTKTLSATKNAFMKKKQMFFALWRNRKFYDFPRRKNA